MIGCTVPADGVTDGVGMVFSSMRNIPKGRRLSALSGDAVRHLQARVKARAMRPATRWRGIGPWRRAAIAALVARRWLPRGAPAVESGAPAPPAPPSAAACTRAAAFRAVVDVGHTA